MNPPADGRLPEHSLQHAAGGRRSDDFVGEAFGGELGAGEAGQRPLMRTRKLDLPMNGSAGLKSA